MSSKRGGRGQPQGKQYGPKKTPPAQEKPPVVLVQVLLPNGEKSGEFERKMRRRDPDFDKKVEIINSIYNDYGVKIDMKSFMNNPEKFDLDQVLSPFKDSIGFIKKEFPEFFEFQKNSGIAVSTELKYKNSLEDKGLATNTYAQYNFIGGFQFGDFLAGDKLKDAYKKDVEHGFHPNSTYKDVLVHEFGHALHNLIQSLDFKAKYPNTGTLDVWINQSNERKTRYTVNKMVKKALQNLGVKGVTLANVKKFYQDKISGYANKNSAEVIAESIADVKANGAKAKALSRSVFDVVKKSLKYGGFDAYIAAEKAQKKGK